MDTFFFRFAVIVCYRATLARVKRVVQYSSFQNQDLKTVKHRFQIQNAGDVLITPLEKFRKEQIDAVKVGPCFCLRG